MAPLGKGELKLVGKTPYESSISDLTNTLGSGGPIQLEVRKDNFQPYRVVLTDPSSSNVEIVTEMLPSVGFQDPDQIQETVDKLFEAQRLVRGGRYDDALNILRDLSTKAKWLGTIYEIQGGAYFLKGDLTQAYDSYRQAIKMSPSNGNLVRMKKLLEQKLKLAPAEGK